MNTFENNFLTFNLYKMQKLLFLIIVFVLTINIVSNACTTAVVSGKYTKDGRPLLLKNRDTWAVNNSMKFFDAEPYSFLGLVNSKDSLAKSVWIGSNSAGFAIMNSASYNLNVDDTLKQSGLEGRIMKMALQYCKTVDDFQTMLDTIQKPYLLEANFGVIDAEGGAAYFELGNYKYTKIDANDPAVAPNGYLIRTNFSFTGKMGIGGGYIRYQTASDLFYEAVSTNDLDAQFIIQKVIRSLKHSLTGTDLSDYKNIAKNTPTYFHFRDYIPRTGSSSGVVVQGVKKNENPEFTTIWAVVGFPLTSVVVPFWIKGGEQLPEIASYDSEINDSPLCHAALQFKKDCLPVRFGINGKYYININALLNADNSGYMQVLAPVENEIFKRTKTQLELWRNNEITKAGVQEFYSEIDAFIKKEYAEKLNYNF